MRRFAARCAGLITATATIGALSLTSATALSGTPATAQAYPFTAQLNVGSQQACTGALVHPQWVITATTCFATTAGGGAADGKPALKTTVRVGGSDLASSAVQTREVVELVTSDDRNVVLAKLSTRVQGIAPVKISSTAPVAGETLKAAGFGRTSTEWVPDYLHTGDFTVDYADGVALGLNGVGKSVLCKGDTGGPTFRVKDGVPELVGVNSRSWQGGCLGTDKAETRTAAVASRADDLGAWVKKTTFLSQDDLTGDGIADLTAVWYDGSLRVHPGDGKGGLTGANIAQLGGTNWGGMKRLMVGEFTGDRTADLMAIWADGTLHLYKGLGNGKVADQVPVGDGNSWGTMKQVIAGDFTGDGIADLAGIWYDGTFHIHPGNGQGGLTGKNIVQAGGTSWGSMQLLAAGDFNGDGIADIPSVWHDGSLHIHPGKSDGVLAGTNAVQPGGTNWGGMKQVVAGDFTGDGIDDVMAVWADGTMHHYQGDGKGNISSAHNVATPGNTWGTLKLATA
jgi:hypothetical protein